MAAGGAQYVSIKYNEHLTEAGIEPSEGSKGDSYDNALAETINDLYKTELIVVPPWKTREAVELAALKRVCRLNLHRLLEPFGLLGLSLAVAITASAQHDELTVDSVFNISRQHWTYVIGTARNHEESQSHQPLI